MSHLKYFAYPGIGEDKRQSIWYSQAVRIGDQIKISGQGGWDPETGKIPTDITAQINQAFANVELCLKDAGGKGWSQVYSVRSYHVVMNEEAGIAFIANLKEYMPDHQPLLTAVGVAQLGGPGDEGMIIEIEVSAHDPEVAKASKP